MGSECTFVVMPFVTEYIINPEKHTGQTANSLYSSLAGLFMVIRMISIPFWQWVCSAYGKQRANLIYNFCLAVSTAMLVFVGDGQIGLAYVLCGLWGWAWGGHPKQKLAVKKNRIE